MMAWGDPGPLVTGDSRPPAAGDTAPARYARAVPVNPVDLSWHRQPHAEHAEETRCLHDFWTFLAWLSGHAIDGRNDGP